MSTATKTYSPVIKQATLKQRIPGVRVLLIQSERDPNTFYFMGIYPDGYVRCQCPAGKLGRQCKHKLALIEHIEAAQRVEPMLADMTPKELVEAFNRRRTRNSLPLLPVSRPVPQATTDEWELDARIPLTTEQIQQGIYCEVCGRFKSHCDAAGHANPPAPWSRMGQASTQATFACKRTGYGKETAPLADNSFAGSIFR